MQRNPLKERPEWRQLVESQGMLYHTVNGQRYWDESAYYAFTDTEIAILKKATTELNGICLEAVGHVVQAGMYDRFRIPDGFSTLIENSWRRQDPALYGRFDLIFYNEKIAPKMLEYNADTPTSLLESALIQRYWQEDRFPDCRQFNTIDRCLIERWRSIAQTGHIDQVHFTCAEHHPEDLGNTVYLSLTAEKAGIPTEFTFIQQMPWDSQIGAFRSAGGTPISALFKLYPWEWMLSDRCGVHLKEESMRILEPAWKLLLSSKAILPLLWELFPNHPNLLPAYPVPDPLNGRFVKKPVFSREGANIQIFINGTERLDHCKGPYHKNGYIYQAFSPLPEFNGNRTVLGAWVIGEKPAGIGIREDKALITKNSSRFIPHIVC